MLVERVLLDDESGRVIGVLFAAIAISGLVGFGKALFFPQGIAEKSPGPALDVLPVHTLLFELVNGLVIV